MRKAVLLALMGLALGVGAGLLIGWQLWPVSYTNTAPHQLRQDYHDDYVLMVAAAYQVEGNLNAATDRLSLLDPETPGRPVIDLAERLIAADGGEQDIRLLAHLAQALGVTSPTLAPYTDAAP
ncbi:MAG: hypothetical protein JXD18_00165 [Anaerolineae bacterium]|nr:hypothetical protein [Anaerolineae bacterium]